MVVFDYNNREGFWSLTAILARYAKYAAEMKITPRDISPREHSDGDRKWIYPVMDEVIEGIKAGDPACARIGVEFIEEDAKFPFGRILKSGTARALRRATLSDDEKQRIRRKVFDLLRRGIIPREFRDFAKLVRKIGFDVSEVPKVPESNRYAVQFRAYFLAQSQSTQ